LTPCSVGPTPTPQELSGQLLSLGILPLLHAACAEPAPAAAPAAAALSKLQQAAAGCLGHFVGGSGGGGCDDGVLAEAAGSLVALLRRALGQGPSPTSEPAGAAEGALAAAEAADVPLLEAAARGLAHISGLGRSGASACVAAGAVPPLLKVVRLERAVCDVLAAGGGQPGHRDPASKRQRRAPAAARAGGPALSAEQIARPLTCLQRQRRQQQQGSQQEAAAPGERPDDSLGGWPRRSGLNEQDTSGAATSGGDNTGSDGREGALALWALANVAAAGGAPGRRAICRHGLYTLIRAALLSHDPARADAAAAALESIAVGGESAAAVYRAELRLKQAELLQAAGIAPARGPAAAGSGGRCGHAGCVCGLLPRRAATLDCGLRPPSSRGLQGCATSPRAAACPGHAQTLEAAADAALFSARWGPRGGGGGPSAPSVGPDTAQAQMLLARMTPRLTVRADGARLSLDGSRPGTVLRSARARRSSGGDAGGAAAAAVPPAPLQLGGQLEGAKDGGGALMPSMVARISGIGLSPPPSPRRGTLGVLPAAASAGEQGGGPPAAGAEAAAAPPPLLADVRGAFLSWLAGLEGGADWADAGSRPASGRAVEGGAPTPRVVPQGPDAAGVPVQQQAGEGLDAEDPEEREWATLQRAAAAAEAYHAGRAAAAGALRGRLNLSLCRGPEALWRRGQALGGEARAGAGHGAAAAAAGSRPASAPADSARSGCGTARSSGSSSCGGAKARAAGAGAAARPPSAWAPGIVAFVQTGTPPPPGPQRRRRGADRLMLAAAPREVVDGLAGARAARRVWWTLIGWGPCATGSPFRSALYLTATRPERVHPSRRGAGCARGQGAWLRRRARLHQRRQHGRRRARHGAA
jgi:hypothetical protein